MTDPLSGIADHYDVLVVGGGITGAGVVREAVAAGLKTLLVEQKDYAWGTSSRSSKMVHGGLRYLASGHFGLTRDAVQERQRMLDEAPGLVDRMRYVMPHYKKRFPGPTLFSLLLRIYDLFAREKYQHPIPRSEMLQWLPGINDDGLLAATGFSDAVTEDARLVIRVLAEAEALGAHIRNYVKAQKIEKGEAGQWRVTLLDQSGDRESDGPTRTVTAKLVINATGAWANRLWHVKEGKENIRPLRGSHLIVPFEKLPISVSLILMHPDDGRAAFIYPWLGRTVIGTTDLDHAPDLDIEPVISQDEVTYLIRMATDAFPGYPLNEADVLSSWSGVRPVVSSGKGRSPSSESREHVIWNEEGLVSVAGGKLTTFRLIAREVLAAGSDQLGTIHLISDDAPVFQPAPAITRPPVVRHLTWRRLQGQYGSDLPKLLEAGPLEEIPGTDVLWAELHWSVRHEAVVHLDDLLLRRTRLGLILPAAAEALLPEMEHRLADDMPWSAKQWQAECKRYLAIWRAAYYLPAEPG